MQHPPLYTQHPTVKHHFQEFPFQPDKKEKSLTEFDWRDGKNGISWLAPQSEFAEKYGSVTWLGPKELYQGIKDAAALAFSIVAQKIQCMRANKRGIKVDLRLGFQDGVYIPNAHAYGDAKERALVFPAWPIALPFRARNAAQENEILEHILKYVTNPSFLASQREIGRRWTCYRGYCRLNKFNACWPNWDTVLEKDKTHMKWANYDEEQTQETFELLVEQSMQNKRLCLAAMTGKDFTEITDLDVIEHQEKAFAEWDKYNPETEEERKARYAQKKEGQQGGGNQGKGQQSGGTQGKRPRQS